MFVTHPNERAVRAQETSPVEAALARLSLRHALKCIVPASTEHAPTAPASNAKISRYPVDMFPPKSAQQTKFKLNCSSLSWLSWSNTYGGGSRGRCTCRGTTRRGRGWVRTWPSSPAEEDPSTPYFLHPSCFCSSLWWFKWRGGKKRVIYKKSNTRAVECCFVYRRIYALLTTWRQHGLRWEGTVHGVWLHAASGFFLGPASSILVTQQYCPSTVLNLCWCGHWKIFCLIHRFREFLPGEICTREVNLSCKKMKHLVIWLLLISRFWPRF